MEDIIKIKVDNHRIVIIGLKQIFQEMAAIYQSMTDDEIKMTLLERLS